MLEIRKTACRKKKKYEKKNHETPHCRRTSVTAQLMKSSGFLMVPPIISPKHCEQLFVELLTVSPKNTKRQPRKNQTVQTHGSSPTRCKQTPGSNHRVFMVGEHGTHARHKACLDPAPLTGPVEHCAASSPRPERNASQ